MDASHWSGTIRVMNYFLDHFGSMNKNDYEVALFGLMLKNDLLDMSDFNISCQLKIPESKIKRLRYEVSLKENGSKNNDEEVKKYLNKCACQVKGDRLLISIPDKFIRQYLNDKLACLGTFYDTSFNTSIVSFTPKDLFMLIGNLYNGQKPEEVWAKIQAGIKEHNGEPPKDLESLIQGAIKAMLKDFGAKVAPKLVDYLSEESESIYLAFKKIFNKESK